MTMTEIALAWKRFELNVKEAVQRRGLRHFRRAAERDGFDYGGIPDETLFYGIGLIVLKFAEENGHVGPLVEAISAKVGFPTAEMMLRAVDEYQTRQFSDRPSVG